MPNVVKIGAKINTMQNINILHGVNLYIYFLIFGTHPLDR